MLRPLVSLVVVAALVIGALLAAGTRPATETGTMVGAAPSDPEAPATTTTTTTTTTEPTTTTTIAPATTAAPITTTTPPQQATPPSSVTASNSIVGAGGQIEFTGTCERDDFGTVFVRVTGTTSQLVDTGLTSADWAHTWTAPTDPSEFGSFDFEFWCGDPGGGEQAYPAALRRRVDMVASVATPTSEPTAPDPATVILPETR